MAETWTIAEAARRCSVARRTLQRAIRAGRLTLTADHRLALEALQHAGYLPATTSRRPTAAANRSDSAQGTSQFMTQDLPQMVSCFVERFDRLIMLLETMIHILGQPDTAATSQRSTTATAQRSTAAPRRGDTTVPAQRQTPETPQVPTPHIPQQRGVRPKSDLRLRIEALLAGHPEGLNAEQIRAALSPERPIGDILTGMRRAGAVQTLGQGRKPRYVLTNGEEPMQD